MPSQRHSRGPCNRAQNFLIAVLFIGCALTKTLTWALQPCAELFNRCPFSLVVPRAGVHAHGGPVDMRQVFRVVMDDELSPGGGGEVVGELLWEVRHV